MRSPNYIHKISIADYKCYKPFQILFSLAFSLFIILAAVKLTLMFKPLYYFDIQYLNIEAQSNFSKDEIVKNYDYVINYLLSSKKQEFRLPSIPYSRYGQIHFEDVKRIFTNIDILLIVTGLVSIWGLHDNIRNKNLYFLKRTSSMLLLLPIILLISFIVNFDATFTRFHKVFFRNNYWQFDPELDPIINILPQDFFYHSALLIVLIILLSAITLRLIYKHFYFKIHV